MAFKRIENIEVWYWPEKDQILRVLQMGKGNWLMFFTEDRYYFYTTSKAKAKHNGLIFMGDL